MIFEKIKQLCERNGISISQLEKALGWSRSIYKWDTNKPSIDKVKAVADYFGVTVDSIVSDIKEKTVDADTQEIFRLLEKCSPSERQTAIRLIQALRGEDYCDAPTNPKNARRSDENPQKA